MRISNLNNTLILKYIIDSVLFELDDSTSYQSIYKEMYNKWTASKEDIISETESIEVYVGLDKYLELLESDANLKDSVLAFFNLSMLDTLSEDTKVYYKNYSMDLNAFHELVEFAFTELGILDNSGMIRIWTVLLVVLFKAFGIKEVYSSYTDGADSILDYYKCFLNIYDKLEEFCVGLSTNTIIGQICKSHRCNEMLKNILKQSEGIAYTYRNDNSVIEALLQQVISYLEENLTLREELDVFTTGSAIYAVIFGSVTRNHDPNSGWALKSLVSSPNLRRLLGDSSTVTQDDGKVTSSLFYQEEIPDSSTDITRFIYLLNKYNKPYKEKFISMKTSELSPFLGFNLLIYLTSIFETDNLEALYCLLKGKSKDKKANNGLFSNSDLPTEPSKVLDYKQEHVITALIDKIGAFAKQSMDSQKAEVSQGYKFWYTVYKEYKKTYSNVYKPYRKVIQFLFEHRSTCPQWLTVNEDFYDITNISEEDFVVDSEQYKKNPFVDRYSDESLIVISNLISDTRKFDTPELRMEISSKEFFITDTGIEKLNEIFELMRLADTLSKELHSLGHTLFIFYNLETHDVISLPSSVQYMTLSEYFKYMKNGYNSESHIELPKEDTVFAPVSQVGARFEKGNQLYDAMCRFYESQLQKRNSVTDSGLIKLPDSSDLPDNGIQDFTKELQRNLESDIQMALNRALLLFFNMAIDALKDSTASDNVSPELSKSIISKLFDNSSLLNCNNKEFFHNFNSILHKIKLSFFLSSMKNPMLLKRMFGILLVIYQDLGLSCKVSGDFQKELVESIDNLFVELYTQNGYDLVTATEIFSDNILCIVNTENNTSRPKQTELYSFARGIECFNIYRKMDVIANERVNDFYEFVGKFSNRIFSEVTPEFKPFTKDTSDIIVPTLHYSILESAIHYAMETSQYVSDVCVKHSNIVEGVDTPVLSMGDRYINSAFARTLKFQEKHPGIYSQCNPLPGNLVKYPTASTQKSEFCLHLHEQFVHDFKIKKYVTTGGIQKVSLEQMINLTDEEFIKAIEMRLDVYLNMNNEPSGTFISSCSDLSNDREILQAVPLSRNKSSKGAFSPNKPSGDFTLNKAENNIWDMSPEYLSLFKYEKNHSFSFITTNRLMLTNSYVSSTANAPSISSDNFDAKHMSEKSQIGDGNSIYNPSCLKATSEEDESVCAVIKSLNAGNTNDLNSLSPKDYVPSPTYRTATTVNQIYVLKGEEDREWEDCFENRGLNIHVEPYISDIKFISQKSQHYNVKPDIEFYYTLPRHNLGDKVGVSYDSYNQVRYNEPLFNSAHKVRSASNKADELLIADETKGFSADAKPVNLEDPNIQNYLDQFDMASLQLSTSVVNLPMNIGCSDKTLNTYTGSDISFTLIDPTYLNTDGYYDKDVTFNPYANCFDVTKINGKELSLNIPDDIRKTDPNTGKLIFSFSPQDVSKFYRGSCLTYQVTANTLGYQENNGMYGLRYISYPIAGKVAFADLPTLDGKGGCYQFSEDWETKRQYVIKLLKSGLSNESDVLYTLQNNYYSLTYDYYPDRDKYAYIHRNLSAEYKSAFKNSSREVEAIKLNKLVEDLFKPYVLDKSLDPKDLFENLDILIDRNKSHEMIYKLYILYSNLENILCKKIEGLHLTPEERKAIYNLRADKETNTLINKDKFIRKRSKLLFTNYTMSTQVKPFLDSNTVKILKSKDAKQPSYFSLLLDSIPSENIDTQAGRHYTFHDGTVVPSTVNAGIYAYYMKRPVYTDKIKKWIENCNHKYDYFKYSKSDVDSCIEAEKTMCIIEWDAQLGTYKFKDMPGTHFANLNTILANSRIRFKTLNDFLSFLKSCYMCSTSKPADISLNIGWLALKPNYYSVVAPFNCISNTIRVDSSQKENSEAVFSSSLVPVNVARDIVEERKGNFYFPKYAYKEDNLNCMTKQQLSTEYVTVERYYNKIVRCSDFFCRHSKRFIVGQHFVWKSLEAIFASTNIKTLPRGMISNVSSNLDFYKSYLVAQGESYLGKYLRDAAKLVSYSSPALQPPSFKELSSSELFANLSPKMYDTLTNTFNSLKDSKIVLLSGVLNSGIDTHIDRYRKDVLDYLNNIKYQTYGYKMMSQTVTSFFHAYDSFNAKYSNMNIHFSGTFNEEQEDIEQVLQDYIIWNRAMHTDSINGLSVEQRKLILDDYKSFLSLSVSKELRKGCSDDALRFYHAILRDGISGVCTGDKLYTYNSSLYGEQVFYLKISGSNGNMSCKYYMASDGLFIKSIYDPVEHRFTFRRNYAESVVTTDYLNKGDATSIDSEGLYDLIRELYEQVNK